MKTLATLINESVILEQQDINRIGSLLARCQNQIQSDLNAVPMSSNYDRKAQYLSNLLGEIEKELATIKTITV